MSSRLDSVEVLKTSSAAVQQLTYRVRGSGQRFGVRPRSEVCLGASYGAQYGVLRTVVRLASTVPMV